MKKKAERAKINGRQRTTKSTKGSAEWATTTGNDGGQADR
jgi:hypothetical protein